MRRRPADAWARPSAVGKPYKTGRGGGFRFGSAENPAARACFHFGDSKKTLAGFVVEFSMAKSPGNPPLTLINPAPTGGISPPRQLGQHGLALWNSIQIAYRIDDVGGIELLAQACAAADRVEALAARISADGEVIPTQAGPKAHPALRDELHGRAFIVRTLERLGLNVEAIKPVGRPSRSGWRG
jgi:hypothetical protein